MWHIVILLVAFIAFAVALLSSFMSYRGMKVNRVEREEVVLTENPKKELSQVTVNSYAPISHVGQIVLSVPSGKRVYSSVNGSAIDLSAAMTYIQATGTNQTRTMGPGSVVGQVHHIYFDDMGNPLRDVALKITNATGQPNETIDFQHLGQSRTLMWNGRKWALISTELGTQP